MYLKSAYNSNLLLVICTALVFLWIYAATGKLIEFEQFTVQMKQVPVLKPVAGVLTWAVPVSEYVLSVLLLIPKTRRLGLLSSAVLMSVFTMYIAGMILFSPELPCSCGGIINDLTWSQHLLFNLVFTALAIYGSYLFYRFTKNNAL